VKEKLVRLRTEIDKVEQKRNRVLRKVQGESRDNVIRAVERLKQEWQTVNEDLNERQSRLAGCREQWDALKKNCEMFESWIKPMEFAVEELEKNIGISSIVEIKSHLRDLEKQATTKTGIVNNLVSGGRDMVTQGGLQARQLWQSVEALRHRWTVLLAKFKAIREK
ncbi:hypothetical protein AAG570_011442, partial [Ranatra chinensis]